MKTKSRVKAKTSKKWHSVKHLSSYFISSMDSMLLDSSPEVSEEFDKLFSALLDLNDKAVKKTKK